MVVKSQSKEKLKLCGVLVLAPEAMWERPQAWRHDRGRAGIIRVRVRLRHWAARAGVSIYAHIHTSPIYDAHQAVLKASPLLQPRPVPAQPPAGTDQQGGAAGAGWGRRRGLVCWRCARLDPQAHGLLQSVLCVCILHYCSSNLYDLIRLLTSLWVGSTIAGDTSQY